MTDTLGRNARDRLGGGHTPGDVTRWHYAAADATGAVVRGEIDATSERDAIDALRRRSLWVTALSPSIDLGDNASPGSFADHRAPSTIAAWFAGVRATRTSARDLALVTRAVATLLSAGVPLERALGYAVAQAPDERARDSFTAVRDAVRNGRSLSTAMAAQSMFPPWFAPTLAAGEASGTLDTSLVSLADHLERSDAVRRQLQSALIYPALLGLASIIGVTVILLVVVPRFAVLITESGGTLPLSTRLLIGTSDLVTRGWWVLSIGVVLAAVGWRRAMSDPSWRRRWDATTLTWPVIGALQRTRASAGYTGTLAVALRSGVGLLSAMALARGVVGNRQLHDELASAEARVRDGGTLAGAVDGVLPPLAVRLLDAGEAGGALATLASRAAQAAESDVQQAVSRAVTLVEPLLILGFGGLVGFVALALLQAIYGINARTL